MRMPCVRSSVRRMMVLVAIVAVVLGGVRYRSRLMDLRRYYRQEVDRHARAAAWYQWAIDHHPAFIQELREGGFTGDVATTYGTAEAHMPHREHHLAMMRKYQRAYARPWLTVEPDPPHRGENTFFALDPGL